MPNAAATPSGVAIAVASSASFKLITAPFAKLSVPIA